LVNSDTPARDEIDNAAGQVAQTIGALAARQVDALAPAVVLADLQPLALDVDQENALVAEFPPNHPYSTAQEMLNALEPNTTEIGKVDHRVG
jgi:hypothetical protein